MDPETLWDRLNDAIDTIIRRDETAETGQFLPPCVEGTKKFHNFILPCCSFLLLHLFLAQFLNKNHAILYIVFRVIMLPCLT